MLYGWMKSLIIYLIFAGAVINLSPSGNFKKYIRFFTGLIAIIILMKPIYYIFNFDERQLQGAFDSVDKFSEISSEQPSYNDIVNYYHMSLSAGISHELKDRGFYVEAVDVIMDKENKLISCRVYISHNSGIDESFEENNIKKYINEVYNLDLDNIYVVRR